MLLGTSNIGGASGLFIPMQVLSELGAGEASMYRVTVEGERLVVSVEPSASTRSFNTALGAAVTQFDGALRRLSE